MRIYLLWSKKWKLWWSPRSSGYTSKLRFAGIYKENDALSLSVEGKWPDGTVAVLVNGDEVLRAARLESELEEIMKGIHAARDAAINDAFEKAIAAGWEPPAPPDAGDES